MSESESTHPSIIASRRNAGFITEASQLMSDHAQKAVRDGLKIGTISLKRDKSPLLEKAVELIKHSRRTGSPSVSLVSIRETERFFLQHLENSIRAGDPRYRVSLEQWEADHFGKSLDKAIVINPEDNTWK